MDEWWWAVNVAEFDDWRKRYDTMTYQEQIAFYNQLEQDHPAQFSFRLNFPAWVRFFEHITIRLSRPRILELGGWHGEMADAMLRIYPTIDRWVNYEISQSAIDKTVCSDGRYRALVPPDYAWRVRLPDSDVFVACHTIEHIRLKEFEQLLDNLPAVVSYAAIEMPIPEQGEVDWVGYHGSHIFEASWLEATAILAQRGFQPVKELCHNELKVFER